MSVLWILVGAVLIGVAVGVAVAGVAILVYLKQRRQREAHLEAGPIYPNDTSYHDLI